MKVYHGSLEKEEHPKILTPSRTLDYGKGFYTTTSAQQAKDWVERRMMENNATCGYINIYDFDDKYMTEFKSLLFPEPTEEWAEFVLLNRTQRFHP